MKGVSPSPLAPRTKSAILTRHYRATCLPPRRSPGFFHRNLPRARCDCPKLCCRYHAAASPGNWGIDRLPAGMDHRQCVGADQIQIGCRDHARVRFHDSRNVMASIRASSRSPPCAHAECRWHLESIDAHGAEAGWRHRGCRHHSRCPAASRIRMGSRITAARACATRIVSAARGRQRSRIPLRARCEIQGR